ncbi:recombinase family protein [Ancylobacter radicis]|uniref:recombinase family protein n=1 Tax=Ancylobacter radicis TaxID=2836179 RepID=UPI002023012E|nr:recombinase family protein [Ancylobacter radicis]
MTCVALYARYSSDNQRDASIEDQLRQSRDYAERQGWSIVEGYTDRAISGASLIRAGIQKLMADMQDGRFDIVLSGHSTASAGTRRMSPPSISACALPGSGSSLSQRARSANCMSASRAR